MKNVKTRHDKYSIELQMPLTYFENGNILTHILVKLPDFRDPRRQSNGAGCAISTVA